MRVIEPTDNYVVQNVQAALYGPPGVGKTTLACTADDPLLLAFDPGFHRAGLRVPTVLFDKWEEAEDFVVKDQRFLDCATSLIDTAGHAVESAWAACVRTNSRLGTIAGGPKGPEGWGALKGRFRSFLVAMKGKDLVFVAHDKEKKGRKLGDDRIGTQPDILGGSYSIVMRDCDFIGCLSIDAAGHRELDFAPSDTSIGKNPCGWGAVEVPSHTKDPKFLAKLLKQGKEYMSRAAAATSDAAREVETLRAEIELAETHEDLMAMAPRLALLKPAVKARAGKVWTERLAGLGYKYNAATKTLEEVARA